MENSELSVCLSASEWQKLTKEQQIDLTYYAQHLVPIVRSNPGDYVHVLDPKYAAISAALIESARKLCDELLANPDRFAWCALRGRPSISEERHNDG